jgi:RNA polymerase sigma-70 factor, ECF subfamily
MFAPNKTSLALGAAIASAKDRTGVVMQIAHALTEISTRPSYARTAVKASDEALIKSIANGDRQALKVLFARHKARVYRFALRLLRDEPRAEDIVSEVFFQVWRGASGFQATSKASTWLLAITRNKAIELLRRRSEVQLDDNAATTIQDGSDDPEAAMSHRERGFILRKCLMRLSPEHREIIDLAYYHEQSVAEVARIVGIPASTVKTRMFYARNRIGELLQEAGLDRASL